MFNFFGKSDRRKKARIKRICLFCGDTFKVLPSNSTRFCSQVCRDNMVGGTPEQRIRRMTERSSGCWLWLGAVDSSGYGIMSVDGRVRLVHRVAWKLAGRSLTPGKMLCHTCHTRRCCNPDHLYEGTHADNMKDMSVANRAGAAKTSWTERHEMVAAVLSGKSYAAVAREFGVLPSSVRYWVEKLGPSFDES
jgi:hypothetical protein